MRLGASAAVLSLLMLTTACADNSVQESEAAPEEGQSEAAPQSEEQAATEDSDEYAFGTDQDQMATAIESAFSTKNGSATWEADTLVLSIDGDATESMAGFQECMVLEQLLHDDDLSSIEYPNGRVDCADVLPE